MNSGDRKSEPGPQGWAEAKEQKRGHLLCLRRCGRVFSTQEELKEHHVTNPKSCPNYKGVEVKKLDLKKLPILRTVELYDVFANREYKKFNKLIQEAEAASSSVVSNSDPKKNPDLENQKGPKK